MFRNMMTPKEAYQKCLSKRKRIIELEEIIATDPDYSYLYAYNVIKGPFEIGEEVISKNSEYSYYYARDIIQEPFKKSHPIIFNSEYKNNYMNFLKSINYDMNKISEWLI